MQSYLEQLEIKAKAKTNFGPEEDEERV